MNNLCHPHFLGSDQVEKFVYFPIYIHSSSVLKKKMLELKKEMCKHLAENSFNADDADACSNV